MVEVGSSKLCYSQLIKLVTSKSKSHIKHVRNYDVSYYNNFVIIWKRFGHNKSKNHKISKIKFIYSVIGHITSEKIKFTGKVYVLNHLNQV